LTKGCGYCLGERDPRRAIGGFVIKLHRTETRGARATTRTLAMSRSVSSQNRPSAVIAKSDVA